MPRYDDRDRYDDDDDDFDYGAVRRRGRDREERSGPKPRSGIGITSLVIAGLVFLGYGAFATMAAIVEVKNQNAPLPEDHPLIMVLGLGIIGSGCLNLAGLVLGIVGSCQSDRNPLLAILGAAFNALLMIGIIGLICAGLAMGG